MNKLRIYQLSWVCCLFLVIILYIQCHQNIRSLNINCKHQHVDNLNNKYTHNFQDENKDLAKIVYFVLMSNNEREKVNRLFQKIINPRNIYILHMDKKMSPEEVQNVIEDVQILNETYQNFYLMQQFHASYLGISQVDIELTSMAYALSISMHWTHYMIISPSDYPLLTQEQIQQILGQIPLHISLMDVHIMNCQFIKQRINKFFFDSAIVGNGDNNHEFTGYDFPNPQNFKILKGDQWKVLSRKMVEYFVRSEDGWGRRMVLFFAGSFIPMEHYFQTASCNSPVVNDSVRFAELSYKNWQHIDWKERTKLGQLGPNDMDALFLEEALSQGTFFARKFQVDEYSQILKESIDSMHEGLELFLVNTSFTKEQVFENAKSYYLNAVDGTTCEDLINQDIQQPCIPKLTYKLVLKPKE